jgi:hypothetical protein
MRAGLLLLVALFSLTRDSAAQGAVYVPGQVFTVLSTAPGTCHKNDIFIITSTPTTMKVCTATDVLTDITIGSTGTTIPAGMIQFIAAGTCPAGWTEVAALNGKTIIGTVAANGNVGTTGGADSITPAGTNGAQTIAWPAGVPTNGAIALGSFVNTATATTGNCAATNLAIGTGAATACKAAAPNLTVPAEGHSGSLTPPTVSWPAGVPTVTVPSFSGTAFDNRSAWVKVIGCQKS